MRLSAPSAELAVAQARRGGVPVLDLLRERHDGFDDVTVLTQDALLSTFNQILNALTAALAGIAAICFSNSAICSRASAICFSSAGVRTPPMRIVCA